MKKDALTLKDAPPFPQSAFPKGQSHWKTCLSDWHETTFPLALIAINTDKRSAAKDLGLVTKPQHPGNAVKLQRIGRKRQNHC